MLTISGLFVYPIKSLGGIEVNSALVTDRGFQYDRRWMLVDEENVFMTQRQTPSLALLQTAFAENGLLVSHKQTGDSFFIPFDQAQNDPVLVQVWNDTCNAERVSCEADQWFSEQLSVNCRLVYMPPDTKRLVDRDYALNNEITNFSDAYPFLIIGQASLDDLNGRLNDALPMNRFRPNIVFTGAQPFAEDGFEAFSINDIHFSAVKPCARCVVTTIEQSTAIAGKEPLRTLSLYRMKNNKIYFGQNLLHRGEGMIHKGDVIKLIHSKPLLF
jgi:uncharacterized protein YcbX